MQRRSAAERRMQQLKNTPSVTSTHQKEEAKIEAIEFHPQTIDVKQGLI
jgi:hypothetical protein